jgi:hypothetical protein
MVKYTAATCDNDREELKGEELKGNLKGTVPFILFDLRTRDRDPK